MIERVGVKDGKPDSLGSIGKKYDVDAGSALNHSVLCQNLGNASALVCFVLLKYVIMFMPAQEFRIFHAKYK
jgi:hypothetical protein